MGTVSFFCTPVRAIPIHVRTPIKHPIPRHPEQHHWDRLASGADADNIHPVTVTHISGRARVTRAVQQRRLRAGCLFLRRLGRPRPSRSALMNKSPFASIPGRVGLLTGLVSISSRMIRSLPGWGKRTLRWATPQERTLTPPSGTLDWVDMSHWLPPAVWIRGSAQGARRRGDDSGSEGSTGRVLSLASATPHRNQLPRMRSCDATGTHRLAMS
jgi:hypothetical protein